MPLAVTQDADASFYNCGHFETSSNPQNGEVSNTGLPNQSLVEKAFGQSGTKGALDISSLSVPAESVQAPVRGGARNWAGRPSHGLKAAQIVNLRAARAHAKDLGLALNRMVTIHWKLAGVTLDGMAKATGAFIDKLTKWLARRGHKTAWLWVHENVGDKCWHCHILIHIPADLVRDLPNAQRRWLRQITAKPYSKGTIFSRPIGFLLGLEESNPELYIANCEVALAYVMKGSAIHQGDSGQGLILGRRCSTSQNIGAKARGAGG